MLAAVTWNQQGQCDCIAFLCFPANAIAVIQAQYCIFFQNIHVTVSTYLLTTEKLLPLASYQASHTAKKYNLQLQV